MADAADTQGAVENISDMMMDKMPARLGALFDSAEQKMGVPKEKVVLASAALTGAILCLFLFMGGASAALMVHTITLCYPLMATVKILEGKGKWSGNTVPQWCVYWALLCIFNAGEATFVVHLLHYIPFYYPLKLGFFAGCVYTDAGRGMLQKVIDSVVPTLSTSIDGLGAMIMANESSAMETNMDAAANAKKKE